MLNRLVLESPGASEDSASAIREELPVTPAPDEDQGEKAAAVARADGLERSRTRILAVSESLRREIAFRLHGAVQNKLILMLHRIGRLVDARPRVFEAEVVGIREELERLIENDIRKFSVTIYPDILRRGLVPALESLADRFQREVPLEMDLDPDIARGEKTNSEIIPERVRLSAYRVVEEALTNTIKHSQAKNAAVTLDQPAKGLLRVRVYDDGQGFDVEDESEGIGLGTMRDYAEALGGQCVVDSARDNGTTVTATLPFTRVTQRPLRPESSALPTGPHPDFDTLM